MNRKRREEIEGYLVCVPYCGDGWVLVKTKEQAEEYYEIEKMKVKGKIDIELLNKQHEIIESGERIDTAFDGLEGKRVRVIVEVVEDDLGRVN